MMTEEALRKEVLVVDSPPNQKVLDRFGNREPLARVRNRCRTSEAELNGKRPNDMEFSGERSESAATTG